MISEKLLSEVLGIDTTTIKGVELDENVVVVWQGIQNTFPYKLHSGKEINIHELAHKCKEWALQYKYELLSGYLSGNGYVVVMEQRRSWFAPTEPEAIFKACEYILNQKAKQ